MNVTKKTGTDSKFFVSSRKGENHELREELRSKQREKKRDAVKKVIANMTIGKDVSMLFPDIVNCIQTDNLELKKLVYLYLMNYAKTQPELALLCVNTFVKDANDPNPLIRALAIRTMGCIRVEKITEYLCEPLSKCLRDDDPYVRKTAAVCVAKLYDISPELVEDRGFIDILRDLLGDSNPTVVANSVAALSEIADASGRDVLNVTTGILHKLLAALNECTEWGQVFILDALSTYAPASASDADGVIERVAPRLQHANSAVVMSALKVILNLLTALQDDERVKSITKKLAPPLVSLLNSDYEMQYVALRNINLIVVRNPKILENEVKVFFCKYNDPIYVKMEKLEIIIRLASDRNIEQVLLELKEYATEVDVEFVRRAVRAIGRCAIKLEKVAERCTNVLVELITTKVNHVVQESIVVIKDIFRKYPNRFETIIAILCDNLESLDEPEAKASMVWIIGEYAERIDNSLELLETFLETFADESPSVQQQLLTATVKLFLKSPDTAQATVQRVLKLATEDSDNHDLRDRGYIYWRLLSSDPEAARQIVLSGKSEIADDTTKIEPELLSRLIGQISFLSSIYHQPPEAFVVKNYLPAGSEDDLLKEDDEEEDFISTGDVGPNGGAGSAARPVPSSGSDLLDLMGDGFNSSFGGAPASRQQVTRAPWVGSDVGNGVFISGAMIKRGGAISLELEVGNSSPLPINSLAVQINKNAFGLVPASATVNFPHVIANGSTCLVSLPMAVNQQMVNPTDTTLNLQAAIKNLASGNVFYFVIPVSLEATFVGGGCELGAFASMWKGIDDSQQAEIVLNDLPTVDPEALRAKLAAHDIVFVTRRDIPGQEGQSVQYYICKALSGATFLLELKYKAGMRVCKATVKGPQKALAEQCRAAVVRALN